MALNEVHSGRLGLFVGCESTTNKTGAIYYYTKNTEKDETFSISQVITKFNGDSLPFLGGKMSVNEDVFLAIGTGNAEGYAKEAVFFTQLDSKWREIVALDAPATSHNFGRDTGLSGDHVFVSSKDNVYLFKLNKTSCLVKKTQKRQSLNLNEA